MKNNKVADYYDVIYSDDGRAFSGEPHPLIRVLAEQLPSGSSILEIGAGAGRNCIFLAAQGYDVRATDISPVAIAKISQMAKEAKVQLDAAVSDAAEEDIVSMYDAIVCTFTLHHLKKQDAEIVIKKMQQHSKPGGFNVITAFTKEGDFYRDDPDTDDFYLDDYMQLERLYTGWEIMRSFEKEGKARNVNAQGNPQFNVFAGLLARK